MKGEYFAVGEGRDVRLLCVHRKPPKDGVIYGNVVNGAWDFEFEGGILTVLATGKKYDANIIWHGYLPEGSGNYMQCIEYVERRLSHWPITNYVIDRAILVKEEWKRFVRACRAAVRNFKVVYRENSKFVEDEDDLMSF